jgi:hypothetical protein
MSPPPGDSPAASPFDPDSYCGIYCGACSIARRGQTGRADAFVACFAGGIPAADLACQGCKSGAVWAGCRRCRMRDCAIGRGLGRCGECPDYPCSVYRKWFAHARLLPHVGESRDNLAAARTGGVDHWLAAQERRWSCPSCGERFSWYQEVCARCGRGLGGEAHSIGRVARVLVRLLFPRLSRRARARR